MLLQIDPQSREPLVAQLRGQLRAQIRRNRLVVGQRLPSMRQLSKEYGISVGIVKQAIDALAMEGYLRAQRGSGVFVAEPKVATSTIALVLPAFDFEQMPKIVRGVKQVLQATSTQLLIQAAQYDYNEESGLLARLDRDTVAGAIIYPPPINSFAEPLRALMQRGVPIVLIDTTLESIEADSVTANLLASGRMAFGHLLEHGHRKIGVIDHTGDALSHNQVRDGADEVLRKYGLSFAGLPRVTVNADDLNADQPWANSTEAGKKLLKAHPELTAIVGMNDNISMGAFLAAKASGKKVPDEISVMGIGDLQAFAVSDPPVTVVEQSHEEMGVLATVRLLEVLSGTIKQANHLRLEPTLIKRGSVRSLF